MARKDKALSVGMKKNDFLDLLSESALGLLLGGKARVFFTVPMVLVFYRSLGWCYVLGRLECLFTQDYWVVLSVLLFVKEREAVYVGCA